MGDPASIPNVKVNEIYYDLHDHDAWPDGPWNKEPDKVAWNDPSTGLLCLINRNPLGALCGYVAVPESHPWHGKGYDDCIHGNCDDDMCGRFWGCNNTTGSKVDVHGGLTYANTPGGPLTAKGDEGMWWFGFDCAHAFDLVPSIASLVDGLREDMRHLGGDVYRDLFYIFNEVRNLAHQLSLAALDEEVST